eukprot:2484642-Rhodomonas_salina.3
MNLLKPATRGNITHSLLKYRPWEMLRQHIVVPGRGRAVEGGGARTERGEERGCAPRCAYASCAMSGADCACGAIRRGSAKKAACRAAQDPPGYLLRVSKLPPRYRWEPPGCQRPHRSSCTLPGGAGGTAARGSCHPIVLCVRYLTSGTDLCSMQCRIFDALSRCNALFPRNLNLCCATSGFSHMSGAPSGF